MTYYTYLIGLSLLGFLATYVKVPKHFLAIIFLVILYSLLPALRFEVDADYEGYQIFFDNISTFGNLSRNDFLTAEPLFVVFMSSLKTFGFDFWVLIATSAFISLYIKLKLSQKSGRFWAMTLASYLCFNFVTVEFIQLRWALATSFVLLGMYLYNSQVRSPITYLMLGGAVFIHFGAFMGVALIIISELESRSLKIFIISVTALIIISLSNVEFRPEESSVIIEYLANKIISHTSEIKSQLGLFSYLKYAYIMMATMIVRKLIMRTALPVIYENVPFGKKIVLPIYVILAATTIIPLMHYRFSAIADFILLLQLFYYMSYINKRIKNAISLALITPFIIWGCLDISNYYSDGRIQDYQSVVSFLHIL